MEITKADILNKAIRKNESVVSLKLDLPIFKKEQEIEIWDFLENDELDNFTVQSLNDLLRLSSDHLNWIKSNLWEQCNMAFESSSYGIFGVPRKEGQTEFEANRDHFAIYNAEDAFNKSKIAEVIFSNTDHGGFTEGVNSFFQLFFETPWDFEHNVCFSFKNGEPYRIE